MAQADLAKKRVTITGGAGFLGINLVRFLLERDYAVTSLDFAPFDYSDVAGQVRVIQGDIRDPQAVEGAIAGADWVVHAAAALPLYKKEDIFSTDIDGTRNVLAASHRNGVDRVVHISSTAVYGIPDHHPLFEGDRLQGVGPYGEAKIKAEEVCLEYRQKGMCVPILRPKTFVGPERLGVFALLYDWAKDGKHFPLPGRGDNRYQLLDVEDLCEAIFLAATGDREKANDTFNIGAGQYTTVREDFQAVLDKAGFGKKVKTFPAGPMVLALRVLEFFHLSPLYEWAYGTVTEDSFVSIDKARQVLGYEPRYSNQDALLRNYQWYLDNLPRFQHTSGISHRVPWKQGLLGLAKLFF
jgi:nucleoside-diphosphate-sugar epimerase